MKDYENLIRQRVRQRIFEVAMSGANPSSILLEAPAERTKAPTEEEETDSAAKSAAKGGTKQSLTKDQAEALKKRDGGSPSAQSAGTKKALAKAKEAAPEVEMVVDTERTEAVKQEMLQQAGLFEKGFDMIKESDALAIARAIYTATKGAESTMGKIMTLGLSGAGTDEEGVSSALKSCPTLMDLSFVSYVYEQKYGGSLKDNFEGEFSDSDMYEYVEIPIKETPFISIAGKKYSKEDFQKFAQESVKLSAAADESATEVGDAVVAATGGVATMAALAAGGMAGAGAIGAVGLGGAATATGTALLGGTAMALGGGTGVAAAATGAGAALATGGAGAGAMAGLTAGLGAIGPVGWGVLGVGALGVGAYMLFSGGDIDEQISKSLSSENYVNMQELFKSTAEKFKEEAQNIEVLMPKPEDPAEEGDEEGGEEGGEAGGSGAPGLPFRGLSQPYEKNAQITMNEYNTFNNLGEDQIDEDGQWGPATDGLYAAVGLHILNNQPVGDSEAGANVSDREINNGKGGWPGVSRKLTREFPGYTDGAIGVLAFLIDGYNGNTRYGGESGGADEDIGGGRSGGRRGGRRGGRDGGGSGGSGGSRGEQVAAGAAAAGAGQGSRKGDDITTSTTRNNRNAKTKHSRKLDKATLIDNYPFMISNGRKKGDKIVKIKVTFPSKMPLNKENLINKATNVRFIVGRDGIFKKSPDMSSGRDAAKKLAAKLLFK